MGRIVVLDPNMINMIAAGEVIERPASAVKELMENSIDSGAERILIAVEDGGRKLISITDNGCGMDADDLQKAFEPHSTSKIRTREDLEAISTLGFRGEALASIASIAIVKATSRAEGADSANSIEIDCGDRGPVSPCSADYGTTIQIRDIFYKLPARRKFLRTANTELGHITEQFTRVALANLKLDLTLTHNGRQLYSIASGEGLRNRIASLFPMLSGDIAGELIEAESFEKDLRIRALVGGPNLTRNNNKYQYVFLNGRYIRDKFISHAIREAYRGIIEHDRYPVVFLFIDMPYSDYDVNVHPTKVEVRFYNSNLVHSQILGALREKLLGMNLNVHGALPGPVKTIPRVAMASGGSRRQEVADAMADFFRRHKPSHTQGTFDMAPQRSLASQAAGAGPTRHVETPEDEPRVGERRFIQIHDSYIVTQTEEGFAVIDQHALHERIMYARLLERVGSGRLESQGLLIPESMELTDAEKAVIEDNAELLEKLGIDMVQFGPRVMAIQSFPTLLAKACPIEFIRDLIGLIIDKGPSLEPDSLLDEVLNMAACKAAIKAGQKLTDREIEQLLADGEVTDFSCRCPHGRPTTIRFSWKELEKQFKRT